MKPFDYEFDAGGQKYTLRYSFKSRRAFERSKKKSVPGMLKRLTDPDTQTADELLDIFLLLLSTEHPNMTADDVAEMVDKLGGEDAAITVLTAAITDQMPDQGEGAARPQ